MTERKNPPKVFGLFILIMIAIIAVVIYKTRNDINNTKMKFQEEEIQTQITQSLPANLGWVRVDWKKYQLRITNIEAHLLGNDKVSVNIIGELKHADTSINISVDWHTELAYADHGLYLKPTYLNTWKYTLPSEFDSNSKFNYKIEEKLRTSIQRDVTEYLKKNPIKTMDGFKGLITGLGKDQVTIAGDSMNVNFNFITFVKNSIILIIFGIIVIIGAITSPVWFTIGGLFS